MFRLAQWFAPPLLASLAALERGLEEEAIEACNGALEIGPPEAVSTHVVLLDYFDALFGRPKDEVTLRPGVSESSLTPYFAFYSRLTAVLEILNKGDAGERDTFRRARQAFQAAMRQSAGWRSTPAHVAARRDTVRRLLESRRGPARLWWRATLWLVRSAG